MKETERRLYAGILKDLARDAKERNNVEELDDLLGELGNLIPVRPTGNDEFLTFCRELIGTHRRSD